MAKNQVKTDLEFCPPHNAKSQRYRPSPPFGARFTTNTTPPSIISVDPNKTNHEYGNVQYPYLEQQSTTRTNSAGKEQPPNLIYNNGVDVQLWCFCFCVSSNLCPKAIEKLIYKLKVKNDKFCEKKLHLGACRFLSILILSLILLSLFFGSCLFIIITSISCVMDEYEWNQSVMHETCLIKSYQTTNCSSLYDYKMVLINSSECYGDNKIYTLSLDEYTVNNDKCSMLSSQNTYLINSTYVCWLHACDDDEIYFTPPSFGDWHCGYLPLMYGMIFLCCAQCFIINIKQFCCSQLCGR